ncbi:GntR family transcriptional regulator [Conexibacter sp. CPCC 206217]|uniref:GntR family transcriptional regulator n=1 Tax=Conexibacter sp. CPCC 206217 TaxID=3064574 RepID=UPI002719FEB8|nr:GntR family transcriptional regulator [Conexibacter sp. CPCC 206217]MDO8208800.1 GntR family transcriptional regulator [Conexibacter sp. CPCC 206217]
MTRSDGPAGPARVPTLVAPTQPARRLSQVDRVYAGIKQRIIHLDYAPDAAISEQKLAGEWGTSKTPVREALVRLQRDGLVSALPRSGYRVTPITLKGTQDLCAVRAPLEQEAAAAAAVRGIEDGLARELDASLDVRYDNRDRDTIEPFMRATFGFHAAVAQASGNDRLAALVSDLLDELERVLRIVLETLPWSASAHEQRKSILAAIVDRDAERARSAMAARMRHSQRQILDSLISTESVHSASIRRD